MLSIFTIGPCRNLFEMRQIFTFFIFIFFFWYFFFFQIHENFCEKSPNVEIWFGPGIKVNFFNGPSLLIWHLATYDYYGLEIFLKKLFRLLLCSFGGF